MTARFAEVEDSTGILALRAATYNEAWADTSTTGIQVLSWDSAGRQLPQQYLYPQHALAAGSYVVKPAHLADEYADVGLPVRLSHEKPLALDYLALRRDSLQPFSFAVAGKLWFASCLCSRLQHDTADRVLVADIATDLNSQDWWGCFVLPDSATVATLVAVDSLGDTMHLRPFYDYTTNDASSFNCIAARVEPQYRELHLGYAPGAVSEGRPKPAMENVGLGVVPNPTAGRVSVTYNLRSSAVVALRLYDVDGGLAKTLSQGPAAAGPHTLRLDSRGLARGVYFVNLETSGHRETRKLLVE